jgi:DNA-binding NarL/FixJ family response regulator
MARVAIVEDHQLLAETLSLALSRSGITARVVTPAAADELLADLAGDPADLVLLDLDLGELGDSTPVIPALVGLGMRVLVVTGSTDRLRIAAALEQGAVGYQPKAPGFEALLARVQLALTAPGVLDAEHRVVLLDELVRARAASAAALGPFRQLTAREAETLRALARGSSVRAIAADWVVSEATVRSHVRSILGKLGVASQLAAVAAATRSGWVQATDPRLRPGSGSEPRPAAAQQSGSTWPSPRPGPAPAGPR